MFNFNRYAYAANSPLNFVDPTGMDYCAAYVNGVAAGIGYCGDSSDSLGQGGSRNSNAGGGSAGGPGGGGGSIPTEKPVNVTADRAPDASVPLKSWYCTPGTASVAGATAGGAVAGGMSGFVDLRGSPYGILIGAFAGGAASGTFQAYKNRLTPHIGDPAASMFTSMLSSAVTDKEPGAFFINGAVSFAVSKFGMQQNVAYQMIGRSTQYVVGSTLTTAPVLGKGALVAGPMIGLAGGLTDMWVEAGWNNSCGN